jgi:predicted metal-dependent hydrolase
MKHEEYKNEIIMKLNKKRAKRRNEIDSILQKTTLVVPSGSSIIEVDKFGKNRDKFLEEYKARMIRPRDLLEPGELSLGEKKVHA